MRLVQAAALLAIFLLAATQFAQPKETDEKDRAQKRMALIEAILADVPNLKLAENRGIAYVRAGSILWSIDEKRARDLYQNSIAELLNAQQLAESNTKPNASQNELLTGGSTRPQILNAIASHDAELALEYLVKTRPAAIARAMTAPAEPKKISSYSGNNYLAQNEMNMEQSFVRMAADQSPARAKKLLEDSIEKGISNETMGLLKKLAEKDPYEAAGLTAKVIDKLTEAKLTIDGQPNYQALQLSVNFLNEYISTQKSGNQPQLKYDGPQMRALADKLINFFIAQNGNDGSLSYSIIPIVENFEPSMTERVKAVAKNTRCRGFCEGYDPETQELIGRSETTAEQLVAAAAKVPSYRRSQLYQAAANKMMQQGDVAGARQLLADNYDDDSLKEALRGLDWQISYKLMNEGRFQEAESIIDQSPENSRIGGLINLANTAYGRDAEKNKAYALAVLTKARDLLGDPPETMYELQNLMQIASALSNIDPTEAFQVYESVVPQINELSDAAAVINGFQGGGNVRDGEFLITQGTVLGNFGIDMSQIRSLALQDHDRAAKLIDSFSRRETRIALRLQLAEGMN